MPSSWYPPAETWIPFSASCAGMLRGHETFAEDLSEFLGVRKIVLAASGRALLVMVLEALKENNGQERNEVLVPGYTCYSVAASIARAGLKIRTYDLDPHTLDPDISSFRTAFGKRTIAVLVQHLFGIPSRMQEVLSHARERGVPVIEDAAQGLGGKVHGRAQGTSGDYGLFSFGRGKPLPLGSGGALACIDERLTARLPEMFGGQGFMVPLKSLAARFLSKRMVYGLMERLPLGLGETVFDPGFTISGMPHSARCIGSSAIRYLPLLNEHRRNVASAYREVVPDSMSVSGQESGMPVYTRFPVMTNKGSLTDDLRRYGIRYMYPRALVDEPSIKAFMASDSSPMPGAGEIAKRLVTLPTHSGISRALAREIGLKVCEVFA